MAISPTAAALSVVGLLALSLSGCRSLAHRYDPAPPPRLDFLIDYREASYRAQGERLGDGTSTDVVLRQATDRRLLLLGDLHRDVLLHARHRDLLDRLHTDGRPVILVLEAIGEQDEALVEGYLDGTLTMDELVERTRRRWPRTWLESEPSRDYLAWRSLLRRAKANGWRVFGLEPTPRAPLETRDEPIAAKLRRLHAENQGGMVVAILGQAHLAGEASVGDRLADLGVRILARPSTVLQDAADRVPAARPFADLPALGDGAYLLCGR